MAQWRGRSKHPLKKVKASANVRFAEASLGADLNDEKISTFGLAMPLSN
jgi:hypothetical protein